MMRAWMAAQLQRDRDPATPPWRTVRAWLALAGLVCSVVALAMAA